MTPQITTEDLKKIITEGLRAELNELFDKEIEEVKKKLDMQKAFIVNTTVVNVSKHLNYEVVGETISVHIVKK